MGEQNQLVRLVNMKKKDLWDIRAAYLTEKQEVYFKRALVNILENKDLAELAHTEQGAKSIFMCISKALQMGIQIGGQIPQAYIVPMPSKDGIVATLIPTLAGYKFISKSDPPVIKDIIIRAVYEKEIEDKDFRIDLISGEIKNHFAFIGKDKGALLGVYAQIKHLDDSLTAEWMTVAEITAIRDQRSSSWKAYIAKKISADKCAWVTDFEMQCIKTAGKRFLKPFASDKEGLLMALTIDDAEIKTNNAEYNNQNIEERANIIMDNVIEAETTNITTEIEKEEIRKEEIGKEESPTAKQKKDLF